MQRREEPYSSKFPPSCVWRLFPPSRPVVDVLAEAERGHLDPPLAVDQTVSGGEVFVDEAMVGQVLHAASHLSTERHLDRKAKLL